MSKKKYYKPDLSKKSKIRFLPNPPLDTKKPYIKVHYFKDKKRFERDLQLQSRCIITEILLMDEVYKILNYD